MSGNNIRNLGPFGEVAYPRSEAGKICPDNRPAITISSERGDTVIIYMDRLRELLEWAETVSG